MDTSLEMSNVVIECKFCIYPKLHLVRSVNDLVGHPASMFSIMHSGQYIIRTTARTFHLNDNET